jgi:hypothetical protein
LAVVYLKAESKDVSSALGGVIEFHGTLCAATGVDMFDQLYPIRIPIRVVHVSDPPTPFKPLVLRIGFTKGLVNWGTSIRGRAARVIEKRDYEILLHAMKEAPRLEA